MANGTVRICIERRLLDSSFDFKQSNEHETLQLYGVQCIPISLNIKHFCIAFLRHRPMPQFFCSPCRDIAVLKSIK